MGKVIVTGGTSGIGQAIVRSFIEEPTSEVLFTYCSQAKLAEEMRAQHGERCTSARLDLASLDDVDKFLAQLDSEPPPDVLVNCAGALSDGLSLGAVRDRLTHLATVNYLAPAIISSHVAKRMASVRRGYIVNITSVSARCPRLGNGAYGSTKAALERFTATLALEAARFKVRTLCVAPAFVETPMFRSFAGDDPARFIRDHVPMREILTPEDVASVVHAFATGKIRTTGTTLTLAHGELVF